MRLLILIILGLFFYSVANAVVFDWSLGSPIVSDNLQTGSTTVFDWSLGFPKITIGTTTPIVAGPAAPQATTTPGNSRRVILTF